MGKQHGVAFLGFSEFERGALASYFRLAADRTPQYLQLPMLADSDVLMAEFLIADADHAASVQLVIATDRMNSTVFIGSQPPDGCTAWMPRPIDPLHVMRELDAMVALGQGGLPPTPTAAATTPAAANAAASGSAGTQPDTAALAERGAFASSVRSERPEPAAPPPVATEPAVTDVADMPEMPDIFVPDPSAILLEPSYGRITTPPLPTSRHPPPPLPPPPPQPVPPAVSAQVAAHGAPPDAALTPQAQSVPPATPPRALLVDDSEIALRYLETRLQRFGLQADSASDSGQAIELLARHSYELVFLDVELGADSELGGLELCQHIKHSAGAVNAAVVMVSAHHSELDRVRGALAGCDAYLGKPLDDDELERLLERQGLAAGSAKRRRKKAPSV